MRALIQRVKEASVHIENKCYSSIGQGILIFLGVRKGDEIRDAQYLSDRCSSLRIFEDSEGKMNLSVKNVDGCALVVSQFTLYADTSRGNRPGFSLAAPHETAEKLYEEFIRGLSKQIGAERVKTGIFRAMMDIHIVNDGPVTLTLESKIKE